MCPPHLVLKWAREVLITVPRARAFVIYDLRNGGDPARPHGVVEVQFRKGQPVSKGLKTSLFEMRAMGRKGRRKLCPGPAYFIVSRETGKLSYHWKHTYSVAECGPDKGAVVNPDTGTTVPSQDGGHLTRLDFAALKHSESVARSNDGTSVFSALWQADRTRFSAWRRSNMLCCRLCDVREECPLTVRVAQFRRQHNLMASMSRDLRRFRTCWQRF
jgi:hypothetical protein